MLACHVRLAAQDRHCMSWTDLTAKRHACKFGSPRLPRSGKHLPHMPRTPSCPSQVMAANCAPCSPHHSALRLGTHATCTFLWVQLCLLHEPQHLPSTHAARAASPMRWVQTLASRRIRQASCAHRCMVFSNHNLCCRLRLQAPECAVACAIPHCKRGAAFGGDVTVGVDALVGGNIMVLVGAVCCTMLLLTPLQAMPTHTRACTWVVLCATQSFVTHRCVA